MAKKKTVKKRAKKNTKVRGIQQSIKIVKKTGKPAKIVMKKQILGEAPKEKVFYLKDGRKLRNVLELTEAFEDMTEDVFKHHVNDMKNDFSSWVEHVMEDKELAKDIKDIKDKSDAEIRLLKHIVKKLTSST